MISIIVGCFLISLLHAVIPNHWLPVLAIGRKEGWTLAETSKVTLVAGLAHILSTILIGLVLAVVGNQLTERVAYFTRVIAPCILIVMGVFFLNQHYRHHHFKVEGVAIARRSKRSIVLALVVAMFFSPCLEIEGYFLLAGTKGWTLLLLVAVIYAVVSLTGMLVWIRIVYTGMLKLNWHKWEHNAGIITGVVLILTGVATFFIS